jgi:hypothetical protein
MPEANSRRQKMAKMSALIAGELEKFGIFGILEILQLILDIRYHFNRL